MASTKSFFEAVENRRSVYDLSSESTISDARVQEIVEFAVKHAPSAYNVQAARVAILLNDKHKQFWQMVSSHLKTSLPPEVFTQFGTRITSFENAHGTVVFFEDNEALDALKVKHPMVTPMVPEFSTQSSGMHQIIVWAALEAEGLGANLQHFNFHPGIVTDLKKMLDLPDSWSPLAQLVFGKPRSPAHERTYEPLDQRVKVFA